MRSADVTITKAGVHSGGTERHTDRSGTDTGDRGGVWQPALKYRLRLDQLGALATIRALRVGALQDGERGLR